ncbi:MAG: cobalamin-binding protein [Xanthomonadales bacterium]|nr:cobalamin-binding protein [Xanthomonadales bacterium]
MTGPHGRWAPLWAAALLLALPGPAAPAPGPAASTGCPDTSPPYRRIVALAPHLAELAWEAGIGESLVGAVAWTDYPPKAAELPKVGDAFRVDLEQLLALKPDLVLGWTSGNPPAALSQVEKFCIPVHRSDPESPAASADLGEELGALGGQPAAAKRAAEDLRARIADLRQAHRGATPVSYFYQVAERPLFTIDEHHLIGRALALCGGRNVFDDLEGPAVQVGEEAVVARDPQVLIAPRVDGQPDPLAAWSRWPRMRAVQSDAMLYLPADAISRATPRMLDAVEIACTLFDTLRQPASEE